MRRLNKFIVPDNLMVPLGARMTQELETCADSWSDSELALYRAFLPQEYHSVPLDALGRRFRTLRKCNAPGFRTNGKGPAKGSMKVILPKPPKWYQKYLNSEYWQNRRNEWLDAWKTCCLCNGNYILEVHHRIYDRLGYEDFYDCIVLCNHCHKKHHEVLIVPSENPLMEVIV